MEVPEMERAMRRSKQKLQRQTGFCRSVQARAQEILVARFYHPAGAREVSIVDDAGTFWFASRVETENDSDCLTPIGTIFFGIEQAKIRHKVALIIRRELCADRRAIIKRWDGHGGYFQAYGWSYYCTSRIALAPSYAF